MIRVDTKNRVGRVVGNSHIIFFTLEERFQHESWYEYNVQLYAFLIIKNTRYIFIYWSTYIVNTSCFEANIEHQETDNSAKLDKQKESDSDRSSDSSSPSDSEDEGKTKDFAKPVKSHGDDIGIGPPLPPGFTPIAKDEGEIGPPLPPGFSAVEGDSQTKDKEEKEEEDSEDDSEEEEEVCNSFTVAFFTLLYCFLY